MAPSSEPSTDDEEATMQTTATSSAHRPRPGGDTLAIRRARPADAAALRRLAELDSAPAPISGSVLVAEVDGELRAALVLEAGAAIADPFHPTADLVSLLSARARQLAPAAPPATRRGRRWGARLTLAPRG
jgi:hypothetical protein